MDAVSPREAFVFGEFCLSRRGGGLVRYPSEGEPVAIHLGTRAIEILRLLVERQGELVSKDEIMATVWPTTVVEESNLFVHISALRRALDAGQEGPSAIQTVPGRGYRFVLPVTRSVRGEVHAIGAACRREHEPPERAGRSASPKSPFLTGVPPVSGQRARLLLFTGLILMTVLAGAGLVVGGSAIAKLMALAGPTRRAAPYSPQDRRESVIVLPFENSAGDPAQDSVAAGLTRDVTNLLALDVDDNTPVVPAATAAAFRGKPLDLRAIAREHQVHFAILGDARRQDGRLIATATLFDIIEVPRPIWSAAFNRPDTPAGWNGIVAFIGNHFEHAAIPAEVARAQREHPADLDQRDLLFAAAALAAYTKANYAARLALLERALAIDPNYLNGIVMYADTRVGMVLDGFSADRESDLAIAEKFTDRAFQLSPNNYAALRVRGKILRARGDFEGVSAVLCNLLERHPFDAMRWRELGKVQLVQGRPKEALQSFTTAKEQGIFEPAIPLVESNIAEALLADSRFTEAVAQARMAIQEFPADSGADGEEPWLVLIAAEEVSGQDLQARADLQRYLAAKPAMATIATIAKIRYLAAQVLLIDGLRRAGIPER